MLHAISVTVVLALAAGCLVPVEQPKATLKGPAPFAGPVFGAHGLEGLEGYRMEDKPEEVIERDVSEAFGGINSITVERVMVRGRSTHWSVKRDAKEIAQVVPEDAVVPRVTVRILDAYVETIDRIKVGDKLSALAAKHGDLVCSWAPPAGDMALGCSSLAQAEVTYVLDPSGFAGELRFPPARELADRTIVMIVR